MLVINQDCTEATRWNEYTRVSLGKSGDTNILYVNAKPYAQSKSENLINLLWLRLMYYKEAYRRDGDTFDINREMKILEKEMTTRSFEEIKDSDPCQARVTVGYPTYTS